MTSLPARANTARTRRYDIDWLRVLAVLLIFVYHSSRPFDDLESWHVKNNQLTSAFTLPALLGVLWIMPLFFILHQPVIVILGYVIRSWDMSIGVKYLIVSVTAFTVILLVYEFAVRRFNLLRFLFGMHPQPTRRPAAQAATLG